MGYTFRNGDRVGHLGRWCGDLLFEYLSGHLSAMTNVLAHTHLILLR